MLSDLAKPALGAGAIFASPLRRNQPLVMAMAFHVACIACKDM